MKHSKYLIDCINLIQKKKYKIDLTYLTYIKTKLFKKDFNVLTDNQLYELYTKYHLKKKEYYVYIRTLNLNDDILLLYNNEKNSLYSSKQYLNSSIDKRKQLVNDLKNKLKIDIQMINMYKEMITLESKFLKELSLYKHHWFIEEFATIYKNQPIYIVSNTDFRTRF